MRNQLQVISNMGMRYIFFRVSYEFKRKSGLLKRNFPLALDEREYISLKDWKKEQKPFFQFGRTQELKADNVLLEKASRIKQGKIPYFSREWVSCFKERSSLFDWFTNPSTGHRYAANPHWSEVKDLDPEAGDIKYVWEKSRFSWLYTLIRNDASNGRDSSEFVFKHIEDWIENNPLNCGPNYKCSQEISLRVLNWIFALYYYSESSALSEELFQRILHSIRGQVQHVYGNINFSRISVRNNHAITECLTLYLVGLLFPSFPEADKWKRKGKKWFEQEISYQIYEDGSYLQFSMNYHRVVVQLLTMALRLSELNGERFSKSVYKKAEKTLDFLYQFCDSKTGKLPNHGNNDGALFFPLNSDDYRDYRGQLTALACALHKTEAYFFENYKCEDLLWYGFENHSNKTAVVLGQDISHGNQFHFGGYYTWRDNDSFTFMRCGAYKDRPSQSDGLHLDIWYKGENVFMDAGSYKYNTEEKEIKYFNGSRGHNAAFLGEYDQMLKGPRFIWYNWIRKAKCDLREHEDQVVFDAELEAYKHLGKGIVQKRKVTIPKSQSSWLVEDSFTKTYRQEIKQIWRLNPVFKDRVKIVAKDEHNNCLQGVWTTGWQSDYYGEKYEIPVLEFTTKSKKIITKLEIG